jgi:hypothetical protein
VFPLPPTFYVPSRSVDRELPIHPQWRIGQLCQTNWSRHHQASLRRQTGELSLTRGHHPITLRKRDSFQRLSGHKILRPDRPSPPCHQSRTCIISCPSRSR